jgi:hypothetical protein
MCDLVRIDPPHVRAAIDEVDLPVLGPRHAAGLLKTDPFGRPAMPDFIWAVEGIPRFQQSIVNRARWLTTTGEFFDVIREYRNQTDASGKSHETEYDDVATSDHLVPLSQNRS